MKFNWYDFKGFNMDILTITFFGLSSVCTAIFTYAYIFSRKFRNAINKTILNLTYITCFLSSILAGYTLITGNQAGILFLVAGVSSGLLLIDRRRIKTRKKTQMWEGGENIGEFRDFITFLKFYIFLDIIVVASLIMTAIYKYLTT